MAEGAVVTAYVEAPLCAGAQRELASAGGEAGKIQVRLDCLTASRHGGRRSLATIGVNARRASEDSTTVAYLEPPTTPSFSRPIVEAANIPVLRSGSGETAMARLLSAIEDADPDSLRDSVLEALSESPHL